MKKLIILSAIALSGLVYNSANAQDRFRNGDQGRNDRRFDDHEHRAYFQPRLDHYRNDERFRFDDREHRAYFQPRYDYYRIEVRPRFDDRFYHNRFQRDGDRRW
jgi:hypothetical protein